MRKTALITLLAFSLCGLTRAAEMGQSNRNADPVSLSSLIDTPERFSGKTVAVWGVVGGFDEASYLFLTSEHARWRDLASSVLLEPDSRKLMEALDRRQLFGKAVRLEGRIAGEKVGAQWHIALIVQHIFVPEDDRQTAK